MIDWFTVLVLGLATVAGAIGGSARSGDRIQDIPRVFMRRPVALIGIGLIASAVFVVIEVLRGR